MGQIAIIQSVVFSERGQLMQAIPQLYLKPMLHERKPIARFELRHKEQRVYEESLSHRGLISGF